MNGLFEDFCFGLRMLRKSPGFTLVAVLTLALGIGANSAIFSVVNAVLLRPLPFHDPRRLVAVNTTEPDRRDDINVSYPEFLDWRSQNHVFEGLSAFRVDDFTLTGRAEPIQVTGAVVSANTLSLLGVAPILGRDFNSEEDKPVGTGFPIILSHSFWQDRFGSDPNIVGQSLSLSGQLFTVAGVMPPGFQFPVERTPVEFWTTIALDAQPINGSPPVTAQRGDAYLDVIARLKAQVTLEQAQSEMSKIQGALNKQYPENRPKGIAIVREIDQVVEETGTGLLLLAGAVGLVLLIACANLSNLLLARAAARTREISVRRALGATRWAVVRQLLTESMLLAVGGAAAGLAFSYWAVKWLKRLAPGEMPRISESGLNLEVLAFTAAVAVFTSLLFGLIPALHTTGTELAISLNEGGRSGTDTRRRSRLKDTFVVIETALAVVLLVGAGLLLRSLLGLGRVDPGLAKDHVITFGLDLPSRYRQTQRVAFYRQLLARIRSLPGVRSASAVFPLPLSADEVKTTFDVEGRPGKQSERPVTTLHLVDDDYFRAVGIPLLRGREFDPPDDAPGATSVVIINQSLAKEIFPGENPVGKRIRPNIATGSEDARVRLIVGVVGDVKAEGLAAPAIPESYVPYAQLPFAPMSVIVRTVIDPQATVPALQREVQSLDKDLPLLHVKTLDEYVDDSIADTRFQTVLLGTFGALALMLTAVGLFGVISYTVAQRTREVGIRLALGAAPDAIAGMIVRNGVWLAGVGVGIGLAAAFGLARLMRSLLYGVSPLDPITFFGVPIMLFAMALLASYVPARRAAKVDPMVALRYE
ncbi:MAG TPA: ABC transporter permease [Terriglobales bacterium]|nr:ABC transporter permease [Terriglobales bacterium]